MNDRSIIEQDKDKASTPVPLVPSHILQRKRNTIQKMIARRAYELFEHRGRLPGHQLEDWVQAESELLYPCCLDMKESAEAITLRVDLPGSFTADQLRVSVETRQLIVDGERWISVICGNASETHTEARVQRIFRIFDLSTDVDSSRATATIIGGTVEIRLPKIVTANERKFQHHQEHRFTMRQTG
jgi:HSP20 family molecular chaperone IbpA